MPSDANMNPAQAAERLMGQGRAADAIALLAPIVERGGADLMVMTTYAEALKGAERLEAAIAIYAQAAQAWPKSAVAEHNLAGALGDAQHFAASEAATRRAFAKGLDAPETWLVHARALQGQDRFDEAQDAYRQALRRRPDYADAHGDLAALIWMRTEDVALACAALDGALASRPGEAALSLKKARLLEFAGDLEGAYGVLLEALTRNPEQPLVHVPAAQIAANLDPERALDHARRAFAAAPEHEAVLAALAQANLAAGRADEAAAAAEAFLKPRPTDQYGLALLATAWRLMGDDRYQALYDYDRFVGQYQIEPPAGWTSLEAFLEDLAAALARLHPFLTHPVGQSLRHGSQTQQDLVLSTDPAVRAFFGAIDAPIHRHIAGLGAGDDPLRRRSTGAYRFNGAWSVRLRPDGFHANHTHAKGWLSSAFYVALPAAVEEGHQGWLKFGEPGVPTAPPLAAEWFVKPRPGLLVLFPSYMWHGTVAFSGEAPRLTIAFDVVPG